MTRKPCDQFLSELRRSHTDCSAVICAWNFPKNEVGIVSLDCSRMSNGDIAILHAMNQQNWDMAGRRGLHRRRSGEVEVVVPASISERCFDDGEKQSAAQPRACMGKLTHAIVGDLT